MLFRRDLIVLFRHLFPSPPRRVCTGGRRCPRRCPRCRRCACCSRRLNYSADLHPPPDILTHSPAPRGAARSRSISMSVDYSSANSHQGIFNQNDMDHTFSSIHAGDISSSHHHSSTQLPHSLDRSDPLDVGDHASYDLYRSSSNHPLASQRYRTNASSSSSLGPSFPLGVDPMYPPPPFSDSLPPFHSAPHSYDLIGSLPSSYSSGKPSPLTPSDVGSLPHPSSFPFSSGQSKDFSSSYHDTILDRRLSGVNGSFSPDFNEDFAQIGVNSLGFPPSSAMHSFQDRLGRVQHESRYPGSVIPPLGSPSHLQQSHPSDMIRGVAPQATHSFRPENGLPPFDDMGNFLAPSPQMDYPLRMPSVDENMARLRLQGGGDLQTFIRSVRSFQISICHIDP
jgi:recombining binding protein suppressor of hairless